MSISSEKSKKCLAEFLIHTHSDVADLVNIFKTFIGTTTQNSIKISVGKYEGTCFNAYLTAAAKNFYITISSFEDTPQLIIKDRINALTLLNLTAIHNVKISFQGDAAHQSYDIRFNYNNEVDYNIHITNW